MVNDTIADMLTRIRNAQRSRHKTVLVPVSRVAKSVLDVLKTEGYISSYEPAKDAEEAPRLKVFLKYDQAGLPVITELVRRSKPGRREYQRSEQLPKVHSGLGIAIISTSQGVLTDREAKKRGIGGEIIATVF